MTRMVPRALSPTLPRRKLSQRSLRWRQHGLRFCRARRADPQAPVRKRQCAAEEHNDSAAPDQKHIGLEKEPYWHRTVCIRVAERNVELADAARHQCSFRG